MCNSVPLADARLPNGAVDTVAGQVYYQAYDVPPDGDCLFSAIAQGRELLATGRVMPPHALAEAAHELRRSALQLMCPNGLPDPDLLLSGMPVEVLIETRPLTPATDRPSDRRHEDMLLRDRRHEDMLLLGLLNEIEDLKSAAGVWTGGPGMPAEAPIEPQTDEGPAGYCSRMRERGQWGSMAELLAVAHVLDAPIAVHSPWGTEEHNVQSGRDDENETIHIEYDGVSHYRAVRNDRARHGRDEL